jgi:hypothetical protein
VIMVDDFRVPTDSGFAYDDYGRGKCLSVTNLHEAVTARPAMFFPRYASACLKVVGQRGETIRVRHQPQQGLGDGTKGGFRRRRFEEY